MNMENKKFRLVKSSVRALDGTALFQLVAKMSFGTVAKGDKGGYVESPDNLDDDGDAWVFGSARVFGDARVCGNAQVFGDVRVSGNAQVSGNARVSGDMQVCGNALVFGNAWVFGDALVDKGTLE